MKRLTLIQVSSVVGFIESFRDLTENGPPVSPRRFRAKVTALSPCYTGEKERAGVRHGERLDDP